jgi:diaminohydroxyphosphoribosylaminopyrimidine deaminase/5-amino-6-(5-phosphoribosylamino)uracil reductase
MTDEVWMARALQLAEKGLCTTSPNPRVGCVIVRDGEIVGEGWHQQAGGPHAEVHALRMAGDKARGATAYVTLEPCSHHGRTPPCAEALIAAGVKRVVGAVEDANPQVAGQGFALLRDAGIDVTSGCLRDQAWALNEGFMLRMSRGRPLVRLKLAMSIDGRTAMASGESQWITGPEARRDVQRMRARSCAVITGANSVMLDDPSMNVRFREADLDIPETLQRQPLRVLIDGRERIGSDARLFHVSGDILIAGRQPRIKPIERAENMGQTHYWHASQSGDQVDLEELLRHLGDRGCNEVLVETGANLAGAFIAAGLVDELVIFCAPTLLGSEARPLLSLGLSQMNQQLRWHWQDVRMKGNDLRMTLRPVKAEAGKGR